VKYRIAMLIKVNEHIALRELSRDDAADIFHTTNTQRSYPGTWLPDIAYSLLKAEFRRQL